MGCLLCLFCHTGLENGQQPFGNQSGGKSVHHPAGCRLVVGNSDQRGGLDTSMWLWSPLDWLEDANLSANKQLAKQY